MTKKNTQKKPEIVFFAEPNGSGKSTFTKLLKKGLEGSFAF